MDIPGLLVTASNAHFDYQLASESSTLATLRCIIDPGVSLRERSVRRNVGVIASCRCPEELLQHERLYVGATGRGINSVETVSFDSCAYYPEISQCQLLRIATPILSPMPRKSKTAFAAGNVTLASPSGLVYSFPA